MGEVSRKRRLVAQAKGALTQDKPTEARRPLQVPCPHCEQDITDRCYVALAKNHAVLFILMPARCPRCGRIMPTVSDSPVLTPGEEGMRLVKP